MNCPECGVDSAVIDSRPAPDGRVVNRRRSCRCGLRWSTVERIIKGTLKLHGASPTQAKKVSPKVRFAVLQRDGFKCRYCGSTDELQVDHVIPLSAPNPPGMTDEDTLHVRNKESNLVTACAECNAGKSATVIDSTTIPSIGIVPVEAEMTTTKPQQIVVCEVLGGGRGGASGSGSSGSLFPDPIRIPSSKYTELLSNPRALSRSRANGSAVHFDAFWDIYPRKVNRKSAARAWSKLGLDAKAEVVMSGLRAQLSYFRSCERDKVPHASTWLHGERWEDDPSEYKNARPGANGSAPGPSDEQRRARLLPPPPQDWKPTA